MSRIDELIRDLCPKGVPYRQVGDVAGRAANVNWRTTSASKFRYIDLTSVDRVTKRIGETAIITAETAPSRAQQVVRSEDVIFATTRPTQMRWAVIPPAFDGQIASTGYCVLRPDRGVILTSFLAHLLGASDFRGYLEARQVPGNYPSISDRNVRAYRIPVPPVEVQREIVRVLDLFQSLEAELEARRQQYAHYRDELLNEGAVGAISRPLSELADYIRGVTYSKGDELEQDQKGIRILRSNNIDVVMNRLSFDDVRVVSETVSIRPNQRLNAGDVLMCASSGSKAHVGKVGFVREGSKDAFGGFMAVLRSRAGLVPRYLYYVLTGITFDQYLRGALAASTINNLNARIVGAFAVRPPSVAEQRRIVYILDQFDALVSDLSVGLPAELAARRQQYEHYRDRLLTFDELPA